ASARSLRLCRAHNALWAQGMKATWRLDRAGADRGGLVERLSAREKERIAELLGEGAPFWRLRQEVPRSRHAIRRAVMAIQRPAKPEPNRSPLRLSFARPDEVPPPL